MSDEAREEESAARQGGPLHDKIAYGKGLVVPYKPSELEEPILMGVSLGQYVSTGNLCVGLGTHYDERGEVIPFFNLTHNLDKLPYCCGAINVEGNGEGILEMLEECGLGGRLDDLYLEERGIRYPLFAFDPFALMDAKSQRFEKYREAHGFVSRNEGLVAHTDGIERIAHGVSDKRQLGDDPRELDDALREAKQRAMEKNAKRTPKLDGEYFGREK